jgi:hypothetical protein
MFSRRHGGRLADYNRRRKTDARTFIDTSTLMDMRKLLIGLSLAACAAAVAACNNGGVELVSPTQATLTDSVSATVAVNDINTFTFTTTAAGPITVALTRDAAAGGVAIPLLIGLGSPDSTGACNVPTGAQAVLQTGTPVTSASLTPVAFGSFCLTVGDFQGLGPASYTIQITHL